MSKKLYRLLVVIMSVFLCLCNITYIQAAGNETATFGVDSYTSGNNWNIAAKKALIIELNDLDINEGGYSLKLTISKGMKLESYLWNEEDNTNWSKSENVKGNAIAMDNSSSSFFTGGSVSLDDSGNTVLIYKISKGCYHMDLTDKVVVVPDGDFTYGGDKINDAIKFELLDRNNAVVESSGVNVNIVGDIITNSSSQVAKVVKGATNVHLYDVYYYRRWTGELVAPLPAGFVNINLGIPSVVSSITQVVAGSNRSSVESFSYDVSSQTLTINNYEVLEGTNLLFEIYGSIKDDAAVGTYSDKMTVTDFTYVYTYDNNSPRYKYPDNFTNLSAYRVSIVENQDVLKIADYSNNTSYAQTPDGHPFIMGKMIDFYASSALDEDQISTWTFDDNSIDVVGVFFPVGNASKVIITSVTFDDGTIINPDDLVINKIGYNKLTYINVADIKENDASIPDSAKYIRSITANCGTFPEVYTSASWYGRPVGYFSQYIVDQGVKVDIPFYFSTNGSEAQTLKVTYDPNNEFACLNFVTDSFSDAERKIKTNALKAGNTIYLRSTIGPGGNLLTATEEPSLYVVVPKGITFDPSKVSATTFSTTTSSTNWHDQVDVTDDIVYKTNYVMNSQGEYFLCYQFSIKDFVVSAFLNKVNHDTRNGRYTSQISYNYEFAIDETTNTQSISIGDYVFTGKGDIVSGDFTIIKGVTSSSDHVDIWDFNQNNNRSEKGIVASYIDNVTILDNMNITVSGYLTHEGNNSAVSPYDPGSDGSNEVNVVEFLPNTNADYHVLVSNTLISISEDCSVNAYIPIPNGNIGASSFTPVNTDDTHAYYQFNDYQWPLTLRGIINNPDPDIFDIVYYLDSVTINSENGEPTGTNILKNPVSLTDEQLNNVVMVELKSKDNVKIPNGYFEFVLPLHVGVSETEATQANLNNTKNIFKPRYHRVGGIGKAWLDGNYVAARLAVSSIGGYVFEDENGNGLKDDDELAINNFKVELYDSNNAKIAEEYTDSTGKYSFTTASLGSQLESGNYTLKFINDYADKVFTKVHAATIANYMNNSEAIANSDNTQATASITIPYPGVLPGYQEYQNAGLFVDKLGAGNDGNSPDGIPDNCEVRVNYSAVNGTVNGKTFEYFYKEDGHGYAKTFDLNISNPPTTTPNIGYVLKHWENNFDTQTNNNGKFSFTDVAGGNEIDVKAVYEEKNYTIRYDGNGDDTDIITNLPFSPNHSQIKQHGVDLTLPSYGPEREDVNGLIYTFTGWNSQADGSGASYAKGETYNLNEDVTLYAQWGEEVNEYYIYHYFERLQASDLDILEIESGSAQFGDTVEINAKDNAGFEFVYRDTQSLTDYDVDYEPQENNNPYIAISIPGQLNEGIYVEYHYKRLSYTITFDTDGGNEIDSITEKFETPISAPENPTKEGYIFAGWDKEIPTTMPSEDITITALWNKKYTVTFKAHDGTVLNKKEGVEGETIESSDIPTIPNRTGYNIVGWDKDIPDFIPDEDIIITAQYTPIIYNISYYLNGGIVEGGNNPNYYTIEDLPITLINPSKPGYTFSGWQGTDIDGMSDSVTIPKNSIGDRTYTAKWPADATYTVKHYKQNLDEIYPNEPTETEIKNGVTGQLTGAQAKQYTGFNSKSFDQKTISELNDTVIEIYYDRIEYTITWNNYDGSEVDSTTAKYGADIPEFTGTTPSKTSDAQYDYSFKEWIADVSVGTTVEGNITYTASYNENPRKYTITFLDDDGTTLQESEFEYGTIPTCDDPSKQADDQYTYSFLGWEPTITEVTGEAIYIATYSNALNKYTVTWNDYDGSQIKQEELDYGASIPAHPQNPSRNPTDEFTYTFSSWVLTTGTPGENNTVQGNIVYTADYSSTKNKYTVTFLDDDDEILQESEFEYGTIPTCPDPSKPSDASYSYTFTGWEPTITEVKGKTTYKATYLATEKVYQYFDVVYEDGLGNVIKEFKEVLEESDTPLIDNPIRNGYIFEGWNPGISNKVLENITYTATWNPITYIIKFDSNGADSGSINSIEAKYDEEVEVPENLFKKDGYDFEGFNTKQDGTGDTYYPNDILKNLSSNNNDIVTLYPNWIEYEYNYIKGNDSSWPKGSNTPLDFIVKRNRKDEELTFDYFEELYVDENLVSSDNYSFSKGSLNHSLNSSYLNNLSIGDHKITAIFKDGLATTNFKIISDTNPNKNQDNRYLVPNTSAK